ncbi:MAG: hypothetical protein QOI34_1169, partial [Verrucomicrobiota bacterium]
DFGGFIPLGQPDNERSKNVESPRNNEAQKRSRMRKDAPGPDIGSRRCFHFML